MSEGAVGGGEAEGMELASSQQQSCECHVCTAPLTPVSTLGNYICNTFEHEVYSDTHLVHRFCNENGRIP